MPDIITKIQQAGDTYYIGIPSGLTEAQQAQIRENIGAVAAGSTVVRDGTYPEMTVGAATTAGTEATISIATALWSNNSATVPVVGVTSTSKLIISPADDSAAEYVACGVAATAQTEGTITFTCTTTPTEAITVQILIL